MPDPFPKVTLAFTLSAAKSPGGVMRVALELPLVILSAPTAQLLFPVVVNRSNRRKAYLRRLTNPVQVGNEKPHAKP